MDAQIESIWLTLDTNAAEKDADGASDVLFENQGKVVRAQNFIELNKSKSLAKSTPAAPRTTTSKLPQLTLPKFDGKLTEWTPFWERFNAEIDHNPDISDINRFDYLYGLLDGDALDVVCAIIPSSANYKVLKKTLQDNFGKPKKIIRAHVMRLVHLKEPKKSGRALRTYYNSVMTDIRSLDTLKVDTKKAAAILIPIIEDKLPGDVRADISDIDRTDEYDMLKFLDALQRQVEKYETGSGDLDLADKRATDSCPSSVGFFAGINQSCAMCGSSKHDTVRCGLPSKQKRDIVIARKLCLRCLFPDHYSRQCTSSIRCATCSGTHHTTLHGIDFRRRSKSQPKKSRGQRETNTGSMNTGSHGSTSDTGTTHALGNLPQHASCGLIDNLSTNSITSEDVVDSSTGKIMSSVVIEQQNPTVVLMKTAKAVADYNGRQVPVRMFFDEGSQRSYLRREVADKLGVVSHGYIDLGISGFAASYSQDRYGMATIGIVTSDGTKRVPVLITQDIVSPINQRGWQGCLSLPHVRGLELADDFQERDFVVDLLIGADCAWMFFKGECIRGNGPTAHLSNVGALMVGSLSSDQSTDSTSCVSLTHSLFVDIDEDLSNHELENRVSTMFRCNDVGVSDVISPVDDVDEVFIAEYQKNTEYRDGKYLVPLPWREDRADLPSNLQMARRRLDQVVSRLRKQDRLDAYCKVMQEHMDKGYVEVVTENPWDENGSHFLPHFYVLKDSETTPLRIVFAANSGDVSLNDCLAKGPCLLNNLHELLLMFRVHKFAIVADIARAFLSIGLKENDRNFVKFLWFRDNDPSKEVIVYRYTTVVFGNTSSPFSLAAVLDKHLRQYECDVAIDLAKKLYVDNVLTGLDLEKQAVNYYYTARAIMRAGGFNLRQWLSNCQDLLRIVEIEGTRTKKTSVSVLGMKWNAETDCLGFPTKHGPDQDNESVTKRHVLSVASSVFDPLGLITPVTVRARMFISHLWSENLGWDVKLPTSEISVWTPIATDLSKVPEIVFPRFFGMDSSAPVQIHAFSDASLRAFGAVVYLKQGQFVTLVGSKSKIVGPKSKTTIPQLELSAMMLCAKYVESVRKAIENDYVLLDSHYWTDSEIGLYWLNSQKELKRPTARKVKEIKERSDITSWRHVSSCENPADLVSRGTDVDTLESSSLWRCGPEWLSTEDKWPAWKPEISGNSTQTVVLAATEFVRVVEKPKEPMDISKVIDMEKYSNLERLLRVTVYVMRFAGLSSARNSAISVDEMESAELLWVRSVQARHYSEALVYLNGKKTTKGPSIVQQLNVVLDGNGLLRGAGRLGNTSVLDKDARTPILLPRKCWFTRLVIIRAHEHVMHAGLGSTVVAVRRKYWIPATRAEVRVVLRKCVLCKIITGSAYLLPPSPDLPEWRVDASKPFRNIGVDFTGALLVKDHIQIKKVYICLFTCLGSRAVNLELVNDMTAEAFVLAFRRHCACYSIPDLCFSDNAKNFKSGNAEIEKLLKIVASDPVQQYFVGKHIKFPYIPALSPWWGGSWERLIGVMKTTIRKTLGRSMITYERMRTLVKEVQSVMNNRPLTYVSGNLDDTQPLTPSMLLYGHDTHSLPQHTVDSDPDFQSDHSSLSRAEARRVKLYNHFVTRFRDEYLSSLRERHGYQALARKHSSSEDLIRVGDVVIIEDDKVPRTRWKLGVVLELIRGADSRVRAAFVRYDGKRTTSRAISKLYPLEVSVDSDSIVTSVAEDEKLLRRSKRIAERREAGARGGGCGN